MSWQLLLKSQVELWDTALSVDSWVLFCDDFLLAPLIRLPFAREILSRHKFVVKFKLFWGICEGRGWGSGGFCDLGVERLGESLFWECFVIKVGFFLGLLVTEGLLWALLRLYLSGSWSIISSECFLEF